MSSTRRERLRQSIQQALRWHHVAQRRTLGLREQCVECLLDRLEAKLVRGFMTHQELLDAMGKRLEHGPDIDTGGFALCVMGD